ncbi:MAG: hypothetical protein AAF519_14660 [Bacteroidota bacterium]
MLGLRLTSHQKEFDQINNFINFNVVRVGVVTCSEYPKLCPSEQFLIHELAKIGHQPVPVVWSSSQDWSKFNLLLIRSVWDYHKRYPEFMEWLHLIKRLSVNTQNSVDIILKNSDKRYLKELEKSGFAIVPTELLDTNDTSEILEKMDSQGWDRAVVKPTVSATAYQTFLIREKADLRKVDLKNDQSYLLQVFMPEIYKGEYSFIFFNGNFSHAVIKKPKDNDFRVQSDFGGSFQLVRIKDEVVTQAERIIGSLPEIPLYARVDGLIFQDKFILMELELIEPELFLLSDELRTRFVKSISDVIDLMH